MELHLVHAGPDDGILVVAVLYAEGPASPALAPVFDRLAALGDAPAVAIPTLDLAALLARPAVAPPTATRAPSPPPATTASSATASSGSSCASP